LIKKEYFLPYKFNFLTKSSNKIKNRRAFVFLLESYRPRCPQCRWSDYDTWIISTPTEWEKI